MSKGMRYAVAAVVRYFRGGFCVRDPAGDGSISSMEAMR
jgi:hypothetical protein